MGGVVDAIDLRRQLLYLLLGVARNDPFNLFERHHDDLFRVLLVRARRFRLVPGEDDPKVELGKDADAGVGELADLYSLPRRLLPD